MPVVNEGYSQYVVLYLVRQKTHATGRQMTFVDPCFGETVGKRKIFIRGHMALKGHKAPREALADIELLA
jgi:hypothetical protein